MPQRFYLWVHVDDPELVADREGAVAELAGALHRDIWRRGYDAALVSAVEGGDRYPRIEVLLREWKRQSDSFYWFGGVGHAQIDADCAVRMSPDAGNVFEGRVTGLPDLSDYALNTTGASDAAADAIADEVLGTKVRERPVWASYAPPPAPSSSVHVAAPPSVPPPVAATAAAVVAAPPRPAPSTSASAGTTTATTPPVVPAAAPAPAAPAVPTQSFPVD